MLGRAKHHELVGPPRSDRQISVGILPFYEANIEFKIQYLLSNVNRIGYMQLGIDKRIIRLKAGALVLET